MGRSFALCSLLLLVGCKNDSSPDAEPTGSGGSGVDGSGGAATAGSGGGGGSGGDPTDQLYVRVVLEGDGVGTVEFGAECIEQSCTLLVEAGESVTLTPQPGLNSQFVGFSGQGCGEGECTFVVTESVSITAQFDMLHNIAFLTSESFSGSQIGGLEGADEHCAGLAAAAGLGDHDWKAWLSSSEENALERIPASARGWVRPDGQPAFDTIEGALEGEFYFPLLVTESRALFDGAETWTGTGTDGMVYPGGDAVTCSDWSSDSGEGQTGRAHGAATIWTTFIPLNCEFPKPLYCLGTDRNEPLTVPEETGRLAFLSSAEFDASTGLDGADALCQSEADGASLPGTYRALLATEASAAAERFDLEGEPWVRVDGVAWLPDPTRLADLDGAATALNVHADGSVEVGEELAYVFTGGTGSFGTGDPATCEDWTTNADEVTVIMGGAQLAGSHGFTCCSGSCSNQHFAHYVYCLEE